MLKKTDKAVALVTGASSGIGEATAMRLAEAGYQVYGTSRRGTAASRSSFEMLPLDVTSDTSVKAAVAAVIQREGHIDLLVNNAGFNVSVGGAEESSIQQAQEIFDTNFFGIVRMTLAVVPHMRHQGWRTHHQYRLSPGFYGDALHGALCRNQTRDRRLLRIPRP